MILTKGHTTLKRESVNSPSFIDAYHLLLSHDGTYRVHIERREDNGTVSESYLYQGMDLKAANWCFDRYSKVS